jgi:pyrimidine-nucleoside phosphorylase
MNQPLGWAVGNAVELREAIDTLHEGGPPDLRQHCLVVAAELMKLAGKATSTDEGIEQAQDILASGKAWTKFMDLVRAQGGNLRQIENPDLLPRARFVRANPAPKSGYLAELDAHKVGQAAAQLGAGRIRKGDTIDHAVGIIAHYKVGDFVEAGTPLFTVHANTTDQLSAAEATVHDAHVLVDSPLEPYPLFYRRVTSASILGRRKI